MCLVGTACGRGRVERVGECIEALIFPFSGVRVRFFRVRDLSARLLLRKKKCRRPDRVSEPELLVLHE